MKKLNCIWVLILLIGSGCASSGGVSEGIVDESSIKKVGLEQYHKDIDECRAKNGLPPLAPELTPERSLIDLGLAGLLLAGVGDLSLGYSGVSGFGLDGGNLAALGAAGLLALLAAGGPETEPLDVSSVENISNSSKSKLKDCMVGRGYRPIEGVDLMEVTLSYLAECNSAPRQGLTRKKFKSDGDVFGDCASGVWVVKESIMDQSKYKQDFIECYELAARSEVTLKGSYLSKRRELYHLSRVRDNLLYSCLAKRDYEVGGAYLSQD